MRKKIIYGTIGNNWGGKIFKILKKKNKKVFRLKTNRNFKKYKHYLDYLEVEIRKKNINLVWISINPYKNLEVINFLAKKRINLVVEKPWVHKANEISRLIKITRKNKIKIFFHFEFVFLKSLKNLINKNKIQSVIFRFQHKSNKKSKIPAIYEFGSHLAAIKVFHFDNLEKYKFKFGYNKKKNIRQIIINLKNQTKTIDFTKNKEDIIGKFILFVEKVMINKTKNLLGLDFVKKVKYELDVLS